MIDIWVVGIYMNSYDKTVKLIDLCEGWAVSS